MKKLFALFFTIVMVLSMSVNAFATTITEEGDYTADVSGVIETAADEIDIYIGWDEGLTFTYVKDDYNKTTGQKESYWDGYEAIEVINYSSVDVNCAFSFTANTMMWSGGDLVFSMTEGYGVGNTWDASSNSLTLVKGSEGELGEISQVYESKAMVTVEVAENSPAITVTNTLIGTLTITISTVTE